MNLITKILGPESKSDKTLPFTYEARIDTLDGLGDEHAGLGYFYADTLCAIVEYLDKEKITPNQVSIYAIYEEKEIYIDPLPLLTKGGKWQTRPKLCSSLEKHYQKTMQPEYKGHHKQGDCSYDDRDDHTVI